MTYLRFFASLWLFYLVLNQAGAARILLMPWAHYSHVNFFTVAAELLREDGHDVTVLVAEPYKDRVERVGLKSLVWSYPDEADPHITVGGKAAGILTGNTNHYGMLYNMTRVVEHLCDELMKNQEILDYIEEQNFDLTLNDNIPFMYCMYTIPYRYNIPYISLGMWSDPWNAGILVAPGHEPSSLMPIHGQMTFLERVMNTILFIIQANLQYTLTSSDDFIARHAPNRPKTTFRKILANSEMWLLTSDINCFDFPRVSAPNYRFIGSLTGSALPRPLSSEFGDIMENAPEGVVVVSFGSIHVLRRALLAFIHKLFNALGRLEQKIIVQFDENELEGIAVPANVHIKGWLPQNDLLAHPNTKLFIGHGGLNGQLEAVYNGVPIITLPFLFEQKGNGIRAQSKMQGKLFEWAHTTADELHEAMLELINEPEYKRTVKKCADILKNLPGAGEQLVFWVNHVLRFGSAHLKPVSADMDFVEFFMIDIFTFFTGIICLVISLTYFCIRCLCKCCKKSKFKKD